MGGGEVGDPLMKGSGGADGLILRGDNVEWQWWIWRLDVEVWW